MTTEQFRGEVTQRGVIFGPGDDVLLVSTGLRPWTFPGGRIRADVKPEPALERTLAERIGLRVDVKRPVRTVTDIWGNGDDPVYAVIYHCEAYSRDVELVDGRDDWCWFTPEGAVEEMHFRPLEEAIERARADRRGERDRVAPEE
jgi:ADP-ribose pyrophosphatase YjhB (NUDIX family)